MAKLSDYFSKKFINGQKVEETCFNCKYIYRPNNDLPFQAELNEPVFCNKLNRYVENIKHDSCRDFEYF